MSLNLVRKFQCPINLPSNMGFAPLAGWQRLLVVIVAIFAVTRVITGRSQKQISLKPRTRHVPNHLRPFELIQLVVGIVVSVCMRPTVVVCYDWLRHVFAIPSDRGLGGRNQSSTGNKNVHCKSPDVVIGQRDQSTSRYSAHAIGYCPLFAGMFAGWVFLLGKRKQAGGKNYPIPPQFSGLKPTLPAKLQDSLHSQSENRRSFLRRANQIKSGLCHAVHHSGVAA